MNQYRAKSTFTAYTVHNQRVKIESGKIYHGGYDFREPEIQRSVIFVSVNGQQEEVYFQAGQFFISRFQFIGHVDNVEYTPVQISKRPRIRK